MQHVGMNIADKARLFHEVHRVLKDGATFALYDVMRTGEGPLTFPVPWASDEAGSFVEPPEVYRALLSADGFEVVKERNRADDRARLLPRARRRTSPASGPPPLGTAYPDGRQRAAEDRQHAVAHRSAASSRRSR